MAKKSKTESNLPEVSKQTAGGITGAVIGGVVAGPVGAVAGGVAGALVGDSSARGNRPIKTAVETIRARLGRGKTKAIETERSAARTTKKAKKTPAMQISAALGESDSAQKKKAKSKPKTKTAKKKKSKSMPKSKVASASGTKRAKKRAKKKVR